MLEPDIPAEKDEPPSTTRVATRSSIVGGISKDVTLGDSVTDTSSKDELEVDEFGLPVKKYRRPSLAKDSSNDYTGSQGEEQTAQGARGEVNGAKSGLSKSVEKIGNVLSIVREQCQKPDADLAQIPNEIATKATSSTGTNGLNSSQLDQSTAGGIIPTVQHVSSGDQNNVESREIVGTSNVPIIDSSISNKASAGISEWSHQQIVPQRVTNEIIKEHEDWQDMPAFAPYDLYDDDGKLVAREAVESDDEAAAYGGLGGAGKGYTRVQVDEDAQSATSMDENTKYLFKETGTNVVDEHEEQRDPLAQLQATKDLLTEGQRIAYVGVARLAMVAMVDDLDIEGTRGTKKELRVAQEAMKMWSQKMMVRLYAHMEINSPEQVMIEQLAEHGVQPGDLSPTLMQNSRVNNPAAEKSSPNPLSEPSSHRNDEGKAFRSATSSPQTGESAGTPPPPPYREHDGDDLPEVRTPSQLPSTKSIDIDLRWTVLCDLFLVLIADSTYDSRSRVLLERVGSCMDVPWLEICRFERRVTDALEMQEAANKETWNEDEHKENRRKIAMKRRMMMMGLATVGGSLVIGLSAGLLAPVIGAGLAAGFTTIGVAGTSGFLAGAGGAALITSGAAVSGGVIAVRATSRRTGAVKTFEYRPLHNNKRVNLIVTVSGWMNGKVDDVRLPYSTVDHVMGDIYSVLWEPEMLQSMGDTINILATEALTQGLQQVLGSTILVALMASLQLPIVLTKLSYLIDNPWTVSLDRANAAGLILADSLIDRNLGVRPITLVGFSLGARVIFSCLRELSNKGAFGLIQNVYLFGSPIVAKRDEYLKARTVVSGRFVNAYAKNDWILGYLFRATSGGIMRVAGLAPVEEISGLENIDVTSIVNGHMAYRAAMPRLLREVGWAVESDHFTEIEDPDPENHQKRQRELIAEIDEARKEVEAEPEKRRFGLFKRKKLALKKGWETYDEKGKEGTESNGHQETGNNVLFDIDAIRAELASEQVEIEIKQLESTLPPMKLDLNAGRVSTEPPQSPYTQLRETKSFDGSMALRPKPEAITTPPSLSNGQASNAQDQGYDDEVELDNQGNREGNVSITVDTPYQSPTPPACTYSSSEPSLGIEPPVAEQTTRSVSLRRPGLRSSVTMPTGVNTLEHNAWVDDEDDDYGQEKEMNMSFE
ncbi:MAG: hypothetical protein M1827_004688 [Pycnora praestabilis]|nr:MAG: hypothetical protein M1827_004688 [Pycnora praestabilis]